MTKSHESEAPLASGPLRLTARVHVFPRREILDPQGKAIADTLARLGFGEVSEIRAGKAFDIELEAESEEAASRRLDEMCRRLLANPIIEDFTWQLVGAAR